MTKEWIFTCEAIPICSGNMRNAIANFDNRWRVLH